jgi:hypothetical protein
MWVWQWISNLKPGAATFLGALTGSGLGLLAIVIGAMINAALNRRRDMQLRNDERRALATALRAELGELARQFENGIADIETKKVAQGGGFLAPDLTKSIKLFPELTDKLGLLDVETITMVVQGYQTVEHFKNKLLMLGG